VERRNTKDLTTRAVPAPPETEDFTMGFKLGLDGKAYRNTGTWEAPTWTEMEHIKDLSVNLEKGEWEASLRSGNGVREYLATLRDYPVEFGMKWDPQNDPDCDFLLSVFLDEEEFIDVLILDGPVTTSGSQGPRFQANVFGFPINQPLEEGMMVDVSIKPDAGRSETHVPYWYEVGVSSSG
jgi:hypothetical protein